MSRFVLIFCMVWLALVLFAVLGGCGMARQLRVTDTKVIVCPDRPPAYICVDMPIGPGPGRSLADVLLDWETAAVRDACLGEWLAEWRESWDACGAEQ